MTHNDIDKLVQNWIIDSATGPANPRVQAVVLRLVGDVINIVITERTSAGKNGASAGGKSGSINFKAPGQLAGTFGSQITAAADNKFADNASQSASNTFTGTITTTVIDVLPNGHLLVVGEKQIGVNQNVDVLRFSGTIDPRVMQPGSIVNSTQVANVRVESRGRGAQNEAQVMGWMNRRCAPSPLRGDAASARKRSAACAAWRPLRGGPHWGRASFDGHRALGRLWLQYQSEFVAILFIAINAYR
eukprot:gene17405-35864_t